MLSSLFKRSGHCCTHQCSRTHQEAESRRLHVHLWEQPSSTAFCGILSKCGKPTLSRKYLLAGIWPENWVLFYVGVSLGRAERIPNFVQP